jgi:hypothetical protein
MTNKHNKIINSILPVNKLYNKIVKQKETERQVMRCWKRILKIF